MKEHQPDPKLIKANTGAKPLDDGKSSAMQNEGCPNELTTTVSDATGYSG